MDLEAALQILPRVICPTGLAFGALLGLSLVPTLWWCGLRLWPATLVSLTWSLAVMANLSPPRLSSESGDAVLLDFQLPLIDIRMPALSQLLTINDFTVNLALFDPVGFLTALLVGGVRSRQAALALLVVVPLMLETTQASMPVLGRVGTTSDAIYEVVGGLSGFLLGSLFHGSKKVQQDAAEQSPVTATTFEIVSGSEGGALNRRRSPY